MARVIPEALESSLRPPAIRVVEAVLHGPLEEPEGGLLVALVGSVHGMEEGQVGVGLRVDGAPSVHAMMNALGENGPVCAPPPKQPRGRLEGELLPGGQP